MSANRYRRRKGTNIACCFFILLGSLFVILFAGIYLFYPSRTNVLLLGIDYTDPWNSIGRSDTMILSTVKTPKPYIGMLSIPRDLWVSIQGIGENRINTAHFFGELNQAGYGPIAAMQAVRDNFGVAVDYYIRIKFDGFREIINALGGIDLNLDQPQAGYPAGRLHLTGNKALSFARNRIGSDDFFRMERGQMVFKAALKKMSRLENLPKIPVVLIALSRAIDTNIPIWLMPKLAVSFMMTGVNGIDSRTITRDMVQPFITSDGADVLAPDWSKINPVLMEIFGQ